MGGTYITGLASHWRDLERESGRDIFLKSYLQPKPSREIQKTTYEQCCSYLDVACCRNKTGDEMNGVKLVEEVRSVNMTEAERKQYLENQHGIPSEARHLSVKPEDFNPASGQDITRLLRTNISLESRGKLLVSTCNEILEKDPETKIILFCDGRISGGVAAKKALENSGIGCTSLDANDSLEDQNKKICWYQRPDATDEDKRRPRVLMLSFDQGAAGLNLQTESYNVILFSPLYVGEGGASSDAVADVSTEQQAIGRCFRPGQSHPQVNLYRLQVHGPAGEECLDSHLIRRNRDPEMLREATNSTD
mmetsp:Transcript_26103/g.42787  ORF Transcript_26103/g.42787 Transcript_26103/m.42787 type:complete len:307 (+) Transcript_26103:230-1150(+)